MSPIINVEPHRDPVASVQNQRVAAPAETISKYDYVNDALGRRTAVANTGTAFQAQPIDGGRKGGQALLVDAALCGKKDESNY